MCCCTISSDTSWPTLLSRIESISVAHQLYKDVQFSSTRLSLDPKTYLPDLENEVKMSGDDILDHAHQLGLIVGLGHLGDTVERQDIDVLLNSAPETFNLFALALKELQDDPNWDTEWMSWFQIAGKSSRLLAM